MRHTGEKRAMNPTTLRFTPSLRRALLAVIATALFPALPVASGQADAKAPSPAAPAPKSANDPTKPVPGGVRWFGRKHAAYMDQTKNRKFDLCLLGDSITDMWPGNLFAKYFGKYNAAGFGIGGDRTENVLWRLEQGELKGTNPKVIVLLIGTNNSGFNTGEEIAVGVTAVVTKLRTMLPQTKILLLGIFPKRDPNRARTDAANPIIAKLDDGKMIRFLDVGRHLLDKDGNILDGILSDAVHLTPKGYEIWGDRMAPLLAEMMGN